MDENQELTERFDQLNQALKDNDIQGFREAFLDLHIYEQGQFYQSLEAADRQIVYTYLSPKELADMFDVIEEDDEHMVDYLSEMRPAYAADMLAQMYTDNAVDLLNTLDKKQNLFEGRMEKQKSGSGTAYGNVSGFVCVLEWGSSDRWSADFVRLCDFLGWKSGLRCHGGGIHLLFLASVKDFYCWKCYESSDLSGISGRG